MSNSHVPSTNTNQESTEGSVPANLDHQTIVADLAAESETIMNTCEASTKSGKPCSRNKSEGSNFCWQHSTKEIIEAGVNLVTDETEETTTEREIDMVFHYLREYNVRKTNNRGVKVDTGEKYVVRVVATSFNSEAEETNYHKSVAERAPVGGIFAINTGNYMPRMLLERAVNRGVDFRLLIFSNGDIANIADVSAYIGKFNFAWANASYSFFFKMEGYEGWGLDLLGLDVKFSKKTSKRLNEVARFTGHSMYSPDGEDFLFTRVEDLPLVNATVESFTKYIVAEFETPEGDNPMYYDGINFCTRRFATALGFEGTRANVRMTFKRGIIKGDLIVVDDARQLNGADFVYHTDNLKSEITTSGFVLVTLENHSPYHVATYDIQSTVNNPAVNHAKAMAFDISKMEAEAREIITNGDIPKWMEIGGSTEDLSGVDTAELLTLATSNRVMHERWLAAGMHIHASQNLMFMGLGGAIQMMQRGYNFATKTYKKTYIPMTNAVRAAVVTVEALENMGGYSGLSADRTNFVHGIGAVVPGYRFADTFDLHGTWDLDDVAVFRLIRLYSTNPAVLDSLVRDGVIDASVEIPTCAEEAIEAVAVVRSPNGPGEYSIEFFAGELPFDVVAENVMTLDVNSLPQSQPALLDLVNKTGLPVDDIAYGGDFSRGDAEYMITAQMNNPGIGRLANAMMCWVNVMGSSFPWEMTDVFGEMVDAVQQGFNKAQLACVEAESDKVFEQLLNAMEENPNLTIDEDLALSRMPKDVRTKINPAQIVAGRISTFNDMYFNVYDELKKLSGDTTLQLRNSSELAQRISKITVSEADYFWCKNFYETMNIALKEVDQQYRVNNYTDSAFTKVMKQHYRSVALRNVIDNALATIEGKGRFFAVKLYFSCLPNQDDTRGKFDRLLFQTGSDGFAIADIVAEFANR